MKSSNKFGMLLALGLILILINSYFLYQDFLPGGMFYKSDLNKATSTTDGVVTINSGIEGIVTIGPVCPVERIPPDPKCADRPYQAHLKIVNQNGDVVTSFTTESSGAYHVELPAGFYTVENNSTSVMPTLRPTPIRVIEGSVSLLNLTFDSGIR